MQLEQMTKDFIYQNSNTEIPDNFNRFRILNPEYSTCSGEIKTYPLPDNEHLFSLLWDIHDTHTLSATILPCDTPFLYEKDFVPGTRTQMHSHEYLELFYIINGEYRQKILGNEFTFHKGELCLIDKNCLHQEILAVPLRLCFFLALQMLCFRIS